MAVICELLGVPLQDQQRFTAWSRGLARSIGPFTFTPEEFERQEVAYEGLSAYMADLVARRRPSRDDPLSGLTAAEDQGEQLTRDEMVSTAMLLLIAGHETTVNLIANGVLALLRHPRGCSA